MSWEIASYSIAKGYQLLLGTLRHVHWDKQVWERLCTPKYRFIFWLAIQNKLNTKDKILRYANIDQVCVLCQEESESGLHVFFQCKVSSCCLVAVRNWLGWSLKESDLNRSIRWIQRARVNRFQKKIFAAAMAALIYWIWLSRNRKVWQGEDCSIADIINNVKGEIRYRVMCITCKNGERQFFLFFYSSVIGVVFACSS